MEARLYLATTILKFLDHCKMAYRFLSFFTWSNAIIQSFLWIFSPTIGLKLSAQLLQNSGKGIKKLRCKISLNLKFLWTVSRIFNLDSDPKQRENWNPNQNVSDRPHCFFGLVPQVLPVCTRTNYVLTFSFQLLCF